MVNPVSLDDVEKTGRAATGSDLRTRILAGVLLGALSLGLTWAGAKPFALLVLAVAVLMCWEWARVVRDSDLDITLVVHALATVAAIGLAAFGMAALGLATVLIGAILVLLLQFGEHPVLSAAGVLYTGLPAVSLLWLRSDEPWGFIAILFLFAVVWSTDTGAFAFGRLIGGAKLAPGISPNKTWSGLIGGVAVGALAGSLFHLVTPSSALSLGLTGLGLALVSQGGDLAESALKRTFGVKDASDLIPGHGGFMDRVDGIVAAAVVAALWALVANPHAPADALVLRP